MFVYPKETKEDSFAVYKCSISTTIDVIPFSSAVGKTFPTCDLFIPTFDSYFVDPCESYSGDHFNKIPHKSLSSSTDHDIMYFNLPKEFAHKFSLNVFLTSAVGREYKLLEVISIKVT